MINLLLFLFFVVCVSFLTIFAVQYPGSVSMVWFDYQIETSVAFMLLVVILAVILLVSLVLLVRNLLLLPSRFLQKRSVSQLKSGISELTYGVAALASSNIDAAEGHVRTVEKLLGKTPLTVLLSAQIAKSKGDDDKTNALLLQLLEHKETQYLATRLLSDSASKHDNLPKALQLAKQALTMSPKDYASVLSVVGLQVRLKQWHEALATLQKSKLPYRDKSRIRALIQLVQGELLLEEGRDEAALVLARSVISVLPDFVPAVVFAARSYHENQKSRKAYRLLVGAWKKHPVALLVEAMAEITSHEPEARRDKLRLALTGDVQDMSWSCKSCGGSQKIWKLYCDACGGFDSLLFRV